MKSDPAMLVPRTSLVLPLRQSPDQWQIQNFVVGVTEDGAEASDVSAAEASVTSTSLRMALYRTEAQNFSPLMRAPAPSLPRGGTAKGAGHRKGWGINNANDSSAGRQRPVRLSHDAVARHYSRLVIVLSRGTVCDE
jgi:hypothetical protein